MRGLGFRPATIVVTRNQFGKHMRTMFSTQSKERSTKERSLRRIETSVHKLEPCDRHRCDANVHTNIDATLVFDITYWFSNNAIALDFKNRENGKMGHPADETGTLKRHWAYREATSDHETEGTQL